MAENPQMYNDPHTTPSSVGPQIYVEYYQKKALVEAAKEQYFGQLADVTNMPKHFGKTIKMFHYMPILDDRNMNDQGIDAEGVSTQAAATANTVFMHVISATAPASAGSMVYYFEGLATDAGEAELIAQGQVRGWAASDYGVTGIDYATIKTGMVGWTFDDDAVDSATDAGVNYGNLYGSSKDVGTIISKIPVLSETGGRVNRVGMTRLVLEGDIEKFGFFDEYTQESLDFDNDSELEMHITQESVKAANEITEDQLQIDLLNGAGVIRYAGDATAMATLTGAAAAGTPDVVSYDDLVKLGIELDNNRCPKNTKVITGSRMIDTKVVNAARFMYIGSELLPTLMRMKDYHDEKAWIPIAQYGAATTLTRGEEGSIAGFRVIVVPEMMNWQAAGANVGDVADEQCYWASDGTGQAKSTVFPMLVVGDGSFTTIGFQTDGKTVKFTITHKRPGKEIADRQDPYGEVGFYSIKWYYGTLIQRPERLAVVKTLAQM